MRTRAGACAEGCLRTRRTVAHASAPATPGTASPLTVHFLFPNLEEIGNRVIVCILMKQILICFTCYRRKEFSGLIDLFLFIDAKLGSIMARSYISPSVQR